MVKLLIAILLLAPVAKADSFSFFVGGGFVEMDFTAPAGSFQVNQYTFVPQLPYLGGILSADFYPIEQQANYFVGYFLMGQIVSYPENFQVDPSLNYYQQWPYDIGDSTTFSGYDTSIIAQAQSLSVTTPEPATWLLLASILGVLLCVKILKQ